MRIIKRKILLEDLISRNPDSTYGLVTASTITIKIPLTQTIDDMGMFTDYPYVSELPSPQNVDYSILTNKLATSGITFPFMFGGNDNNVVVDGFSKTYRLDGAKTSDWYVASGVITGYTDSKLELVKSYKKNTPYIVGFDMAKETYVNYENNTIDGRSRVTQISDGSTGYTIDANNDSNIGTANQTTGIQYVDTRFNRDVSLDEANLGVRVKNYSIPQTSFRFNGEGWNNTNSSLAALNKDEYLLGITAPPEIESDVFIERGATTVLENHLRLSEVESLDHMQIYGNGFYNIVKQ